MPFTARLSPLAQLTTVTASVHLPIWRLWVLLRLLRIAAVVGAVLVVPGSPSPEVAYATVALPAPPPDCVSTGPLLRYVTLFDAETPERRAAPEIRAACGTSI